MIRYGFLLSPVILYASKSIPMAALPLPVAQAALGAPGVVPPGSSSTALPGSAPAALAAVPSTEVATLADEEDLAAPTTLDLSELHSHLREPRRATLDGHRQP